MMDLEMFAYDPNTGMTYNNLPVIPVDDDFCEHLEEHGFETIELDELFIEWDDWAKENVDE